MHQPFDTVMANSRVKTRSSEQAMVPVEAYISMVTRSSSEEDSEIDDQSYSPTEVYALTWQVILLISCIRCLALHRLDIIYTIFKTMFLVQTSYLMPSI